MLTEKDYIIEDQDSSKPFAERLKNRQKGMEESPEHDPFLINEMEQGVERIIEALKNNEKIMICGDYDTDGVTATTIMMRGLSHLGADVSYRIPDRLKEGYGMNMNMVNEINEGGYDLVITVDNGIRSKNEIAALHPDVIVTDHHECPDELPECIVMDCRRKDNTYPFDTICGAEMAYKLNEALYKKLGRSGEERKLLQYAAIGTVGDVMPMKDENRTIVKEGLKIIENSPDEGIRALASLVNGKLNAEAIGFYISPMINASSRVGDIRCALDLMLCDDRKEAESLAKMLGTYNDARKKISSDILKEATEQVLAGYDFRTQDPIIVYGNWHRGVIGVTASKLVELFERPAIVVSTDKNVGSCRSFGGLDMMEMLDYASDALERYGGHPGAAGITVKDINAFRSKCHDFMKGKQLEVPKQRIDMRIKPSDINMNSVNEIAKYEPYSGEDAPAPRFVSAMKIEEVRRVGKPDPEKNKAGFEHLSVKLTDGQKSYRGIGFFMGDMADMLQPGQIIDAVFRLDENRFVTRSGKEIVTAQMMLDDIITNEKEPDKFRLPDIHDFTQFYDMVQEMIERDTEKTVLISERYLNLMIKNKNPGEEKYPRARCLLGALNESRTIVCRDTGHGIAIRDGGEQKVRLSQTRAFKKEKERIMRYEKDRFE